MVETHLRQAATILLESTIRIAPPDARDWGRGILGELGYVEGPWAVAMWAMGGASVLARQALVSLMLPDRRGRALTPDGGLFAKSFPLRKVALVVCAVFVLGSLLFFLGPPYRQDVRISLAAWREVLLVQAENIPLSEEAGQPEPLGARIFGREIAARNALVLHVATLALLIFSTITVFAGAALGLGLLRRTRHDPPRPQSLAWAALLSGALGFLLSSATIYLTYRPYWYIHQNTVLNGSRSPANPVRSFPTVAQSLHFYGYSTASFPLYFWMGVILLGAIGLVLILIRHFLGRPRANQSA